MRWTWCGPFRRKSGTTTNESEAERPGSEAARLAEIAGARLGDRCQLIELGALSADQARSLARTVLGVAAEEPTIDLVVERGGGLPGPLLRAAFLAPSLRSEREQEEEGPRRRASC